MLYSNPVSSNVLPKSAGNLPGSPKLPYLPTSFSKLCHKKNFQSNTFQFNTGTGTAGELCSSLKKAATLFGFKLLHWR
jgi:hypothetical protein